MHKCTIRRRLRMLLAAGICLFCLSPAQANGQGEQPIRPARGSAAPVQSGPAIRPALGAEEDLPQRLSRLLSSQLEGLELSEEEAGLLRIRLVQNSRLLDRLEGGGLSRGEVGCLIQPDCRPDLLEEYRTWLSRNPGSDPAQAVLQVNRSHEAPEDPFSALPNCRPDRLERYMAWAGEHPEDAPETAVLQVNMDLDRPPYEDLQEVEEPDSTTVLVNKYHILPDSYVPQTEVLGKAYGTGSLRPEAAQAFRAMADEARKDGVSLHSVSAYRSYAAQRSLYSRYLTQYKRAVVDTFSARPGHSEHQTGLALDINTASTRAHFENTRAYAWLQAHCAQYGFLLRYPQGKEHITGYRFEPWHYRYVGVEIASACMEQGLAYEEYLALAEPREAGAAGLPEAGPEGLDLSP